MARAPRPAFATASLRDIDRNLALLVGCLSRSFTAAGVGHVRRRMDELLDARLVLAEAEVLAGVDLGLSVQDEEVGV